MDTIDTRILSELFSEIIREWLTEDELEEIDKRNRTDEYKNSNICATHEFCDPNQAMIDAIEALGLEFDTQNEQQGVAIDAAWEFSKSHGFSKRKEINNESPDCL